MADEVEEADLMRGLAQGVAERRAILAAVQENSRISNRELAARVGLGRPMQALIAVQLPPQSAEVVTRFLDAVVDDPCVLDATVLSGETDVLIRVAVPSSEAIRTFAWQKVTSVPSVRSIQTHIVYEHRRGATMAPADPTA